RCAAPMMSGVEARHADAVANSQKGAGNDHFFQITAAVGFGDIGPAAAGGSASLAGGANQEYQGAKRSYGVPSTADADSERKDKRLDGRSCRRPPRRRAHPLCR